MLEIIIGVAGIVGAIAAVIALKPIFQMKKSKPGVIEALEDALRQPILGYEVITYDGGTHSYKHPILSKQISIDSTVSSLPPAPPEPSEHSRELAEQIPEDADPYSKALKAITNKDLDKARVLLDEAEKNKEEELIKIYETRGLTEYYDGYYAKAAEWFQKLLDFKPDDLYWLHVTTEILNNAGDYETVMPLAEKALKISEKRYGSDHEDVATSLNNLAELYWHQGLFEKSELMLERALGIREKVLGAQHPSVATSLGNLGYLYMEQGLYDKAEPLLERALSIREKVLGPQHTHVALSLNHLALLYEFQVLYDKAVPLLERALEIRETVLGKQHPDVAQSLNNLAELYDNQGLYDKAEPLYLSALEIREKAL